MIIVFDIGNVLIKTSYENVTNSLSIKEEDFEKDQYYFEFSKGKISAREYYEHFVEVQRLDICYSDFCIAWNNLFIEEVFGMEDLIKYLSQKYKLYILSNSNVLHGLFAQRRYSHLFANFNCIFYSFCLGFRKPDEQVFDALLQLTKTSGEEIIFIDDKEENILAARKKRILGIRFEGIECLKSTLFEIINEKN